MPSSFAITTAANNTPLDGARQGQTVFTVSNTSVRALRGRARIVPDRGAEAAWFALSGKAERDFAVNGTEQYTVQIAVPPTATEGTYSVRLDMIGVDNPDEDFTPGPSVNLVVPAPVPAKKSFPWWIVAVIAGIIIIGVVLAVVLSPKEIEVPNQIGTSLIAAQPTLEAAGLKVNVVLATAESRQVNLIVAQNPGGGTKVQSGTSITLSVGVARPNTPTPTPTPTATPTSTPTPTATPDRQTTTQLSSSPVNSAARGQSTTFIAQVTANDGRPLTGKVRFTADNGGALPGCATPVPVNNGIAACATNGLTTGSHALTATYTGDGNHAISASKAYAFVVTPATTSISIAARVTISFPTFRYTATATVKNTSPGSTLIPAGTVTFRFAAGSNVTRTCTLGANGTCSVTLTGAVPSLQVSAAYSPSTNDFSASTSNQIGATP